MAIKITENGVVRYENEPNVDRLLFPNLPEGSAILEMISSLNDEVTTLVEEMTELQESQGFEKKVDFDLVFVQGNINDSTGADSGSTHVIRTNSYYDVSDTNTMTVVYSNQSYPQVLFCALKYATDGGFIGVDYKHAGTFELDVTNVATVRFKIQREDSVTVIDPTDGPTMIQAGYSAYTTLATDESVAEALESAKAYTDSKTALYQKIKLVWETGKIGDSGQNSQSTNTSYIRSPFGIQLPKETLNYDIPTGYNVDLYVYNGSDFSTLDKKVSGLSGSGSQTVTQGQYIRFVLNRTDLAAIDVNTGDVVIISCASDLPEIVSDVDANRISSYVSFSLFTDFGVCGDSFASGGIFPDGNAGITDYEVSWPQILARKYGATCYNYSVGGVSTKDWLANSSRGLAKLLSDPAKKLYILNFGINDNTQISAGTFTLGTVDDIKEDYTQNPESFFGCYGRIIGNIQAHATGAPIIILSVARPTERNMDVSIKAIAEKCGLPYIQLTDDAYFDSGYFLGSFSNNHPLAYGYSGMANAIDRLICRYIAEHPSYFKSYQ